MIHVDDDSSFLFYNAKSGEAFAQEISADDDDTSAIGSLQWELPCKQFDQLYENLFYEDNIKTDVI